MKGKVIVPENLKFGMIKIGFGNTGIFDKWKQRTIWEVEGTVIFNGKAKIKHGSKISCSGQLTLGNGFSINSNSIIICKKKIDFEEGARISWNCMIMDTDFQIIRDENNNHINPDKAIFIGKSVLIASNSIVLKGVYLPDFTIVSAGSVVVKGLTDTKCIIGGNPAKIIKKGVCWYWSE